MGSSADYATALHQTMAQPPLTRKSRVLGILVSLFIGLFALDAFSPDKPFADALLDFLVHLIPALVVLTIVAVSWRHEWVGALA